jgi:serine/threonine-protein kinase HipA
MTTATVRLWGRDIGAVYWDASRNIGTFQYVPEFVDTTYQIAPITMPSADTIYSFPALPRETFHGLPGMLADSLPDDYGNALIDAWLAQEGRDASSFNPVERLCYTGTRGMGALEYLPAAGPVAGRSEVVDMKALVELASEILTQRNQINRDFTVIKRKELLQQILSVGTSAGGARAKAIIAWNRDTNEVRSGQVEAGSGFSYWILKFDGVSGNKDKELEDPKGYGLIELAYNKMALAAGIDMTECRPLKEGGRTHFMTRRFDRTQGGKKLHMQSLGAMAHFDYKKPAAYSYEQAIRIMREIGLGANDVEQQFRRTAFNIIARNQDDHVKNIAFLMDKEGTWYLSPAYDVTYSYNPSGDWTGQHQMSMNGKRDNFELEDFKAFAKNAFMKRGRAESILSEVRDAVMEWETFAENAGVPDETASMIQRTHRSIV